MEIKGFELIAKEQFKFLESDFDFQISKCNQEDWGYELIYLNKTTGVKITYEFREAYIFILLYKLINGKMLENPRNIQENTILNHYCPTKNSNFFSVTLCNKGIQAKNILFKFMG